MSAPVEKSPALPALRSLGKLADIRPCIVTDTREQQPLSFEILDSVSGTLQSGDYSVCGLEDKFAIERKSIADVTSCCVGENRARFERELHRLRGFQFARLLIVGSVDDIERHEYRSRIEPKVVLNTLSAFEARYIPVVFQPTPTAAAMQVEKWAFWFSREIIRAANGLLRGHNRASKTGHTTDGKCARQYSRTLTKPQPKIETQNGTQKVEERRAR